jgi:hypothetical protein
MMSTLRSPGDTFSFYTEPKSPSVFRRFLGAVGTYWSAIRDGLAAARTYKELVRKGAPHEAAVERVFEQHLGGR